MLDTAKYSFKKYHGQIRLITKTNKIEHAFAWFIAVIAVKVNQIQSFANTLSHCYLIIIIILDRLLRYFADTVRCCC